MYKFYTGTFTDWYNGGCDEYFAVATPDEIPASCKDIRETYANSVEDAIVVRFGALHPPIGQSDNRNLPR